MAPHVSPVAGRLITYHFLTEGRAYARLLDGRREKLTAGDIVIFPHGDAHMLGNGSPEKPVELLAHGRKSYDCRESSTLTARPITYAFGRTLPDANEP